MHQSTLLITAEGACVLPDSEAFLGALGDPAPDYDAVGFAIRNLGFVKFQVLDRIVVEIELHPRNVERRALIALERLLEQTSTGLFRIKYLDSEWRSEISASADHTLARIRELCAPVFAPPPAEKFSAEGRNYEHLGRDGAVPLRLFAQKWRTAFGNFDSDMISFAIDHQILPRLAVAKIEPGSPDPVLSFIGDGIVALGKSYPFEGVGRRIQNMPDREYGAWIAEFYKAVAASGQPRYDVVRACIQDEAGASQLIRYERLLLPWKTSSGGVLVSLVSNRISDNSGTEAGTLTGPPLARKLAKSV